MNLDLIQAEPVPGFESLHPHVGVLQGRVLTSERALYVLLAPSVPDLLDLCARTIWSEHPTRVHFPRRWKRGTPVDIANALTLLLAAESAHRWTSHPDLEVLDRSPLFSNDAR